MTGNIIDQLLSSDTVASLQMEARVSKVFTELKWDVQRSLYYKDLTTDKIREMDVYALKTFQASRRQRMIGEPTINLKVVCECKNLKGNNIIFESEPALAQQVRMQRYWLGSEKDVRELVSTIARDTNLNNSSRIEELYRYVIKRAYYTKSGGLARSLMLPVPPVALTSRAYRETKGGNTSNSSNPEGKRLDPSWSAIQSTKSATEALKTSTKEACLSWVNTSDIKFRGVFEFTKGAAFFLDAELMRNVFFHQIIVLNAKLWNLEQEELKEVGSARLFIKDIDMESFYVDFVYEDKIKQYMEDMTRHFDKEARKAISNLWKINIKTGWIAGQDEKTLRNAVMPFITFDK